MNEKESQNIKDKKRKSTNAIEHIRDVIRHIKLTTGETIKKELTLERINTVIELKDENHFYKKLINSIDNHEFNNILNTFRENVCKSNEIRLIEFHSAELEMAKLNLFDNLVFSKTEMKQKRIIDFSKIIDFSNCSFNSLNLKFNNTQKKYEKENRNDSETNLCIKNNFPDIFN